jgi:RNA polymerase sigma-70 factor, ECF subfamily
LNRKIDATTQPSLVLRLRDHSDTSAWNEFVDVYSPLIYNFCRSKDMQSSDAADITQEVLLRISKAIQRFEYDHAKGLFRDWLARIVLNEIRRLMKRSTPLVVSTEELDQEDGKFANSWNEQFQQHIFATALERSKVHFNEETWKMFEMSWLQKMEVEQVSQVLGVSIDRIYVARSRVLKRLRYEVATLADDIS